MKFRAKFMWLALMPRIVKQNGWAGKWKSILYKYIFKVSSVSDISFYKRKSE